MFVAMAFCYGQESRFFMPSELLSAYEAGSRSYTGKPGPNYWQNTVDYTIEVSVDPTSRKLTGSEKITYYNNSPDDLGQLVIRLYQDVFREANPRSFRVNPDDINEGVAINRLAVRGEELDLEGNALRRSGTNAYLNLEQPLESGGSIMLELDWEAYVPETTVRGGAYDSTTYFVSYWYPQIAVYDDVFGWDRLEYDFSTEFYNNLANFDVRISAPENFTILSTGVLQNAGEILNAPMLERYNKARTSDETISIISPDDLESGIQHKSGTWHYKAREVSDFAFCISDVYCWDAAMQPVADREVLIHTY
ncbi:MAG: hypothetical protein KDC44_04900, partial [Phaeodactylibacter sp.]|nr:hypothetical protein [Phaeodactylibacter sp.]